MTEMDDVAGNPEINILALAGQQPTTAHRQSLSFLPNATREAKDQAEVSFAEWVAVFVIIPYFLYPFLDLDARVSKGVINHALSFSPRTVLSLLSWSLTFPSPWIALNLDQWHSLVFLSRQRLCLWLPLYHGPWTIMDPPSPLSCVKLTSWPAYPCSGTMKDSALRVHSPDGEYVNNKMSGDIMPFESNCCQPFRFKPFQRSRLH